MNNPIKITGLTTEKCYAYEYPVLHIENVNGNKAYIMMFRFHWFQACGTVEGEWDFGHSRFKWYETDPLSIDTMYQDFVECLNGYISTPYGGENNPRTRYLYDGQIYLNEYMERKYNPENIEQYFDIKDMDFELITKFLEKSIDLINTYFNRVA